MKRNALKCLTVIFRDLLNYSRQAINMILRPAWKLLNQSLPIFTEVVGYSKKASDSDSQEEDQENSWDDDDVDRDEMDGVQGMIYQSLELLATLVQRPNVQQLILQGIVPLTSTVCSYLIVPSKEEHVFKHEAVHFL